MTPEKQTKDPKAAQKQKIIIVVIVVIVLVILWQFIGGGSSSTPTIAPSSVASAPGKPAAGNAMQASSSGASMAAASMASAPPATPELKHETIPLNPDLPKVPQQSQTEFISSLNKLQMLKLQREIDETKTAIATAELNRMTAEKNIADLITSKQDVAPPPTALPNASPPTMPVLPQAAPAVVAEFPYTVMSVAYEGRKWAAVVSAGAGKIYTVNVGDTLSADGSTVIAIDKQGVTLQRHMTTRIISLTSSI